jgi:hypothetical protein
MVSRMRYDFVFVVRCESEEAFFDRFARNFWRKGATTVDLEKYCWFLFLHEYIKLGGRTRKNPWRCIPSMDFTINIYIRSSVDYKLV